MSFGELGVAALGGYLLVLIAVAEIARRSRQDATPSDHFLAGRDLGVLVLFLTLYATAYSGNSLLGYPGRAYQAGFSFIMSTGFMMAIIVLFHAIAPRLRPIAAHGPLLWIRCATAAGSGTLQRCAGVVAVGSRMMRSQIAQRDLSARSTLVASVVVGRPMSCDKVRSDP